MPSVDQLQKLLAASPADAFLLYAIAQEYAKSGDHVKAIEFYDRAIAVAPDDGYTYFHKARSLGAIGRTEAQVGALKAGVNAAKRSSDAKALGELQAVLDELE
ncbi:MAG: tetratricopeptide repeat protein [Phycisphaeraceae bacterium]|nr:tetratricopeptide repeat protein [Phycisphaeraceae bacterium]